MKPVAIVQHSSTEGPGYFATYLERHRLEWRLIALDRGEPLPATPDEFSGLVLMGGAMSVNDPLPWIEPVLRLISSAVSSDIPVLGHCLGGQLIARALGGVVSRNRVQEIGWGDVTVATTPEGRRWFGDYVEFLSFHWHGETFTVPEGASRIASSRYCDNQAFAYGPHLALQCHVEMTPGLIRAWISDWTDEVTALARESPSVQTPAQMENDIDARIRRLHAVADRLYACWVEGLKQ